MFLKDILNLQSQISGGKITEILFHFSFHKKKKHWYLSSNFFQISDNDF